MSHTARQASPADTRTRTHTHMPTPTHADPPGTLGRVAVVLGVVQTGNETGLRSVRGH